MFCLILPGVFFFSSLLSVVFFFSELKTKFLPVQCLLHRFNNKSLMNFFTISIFPPPCTNFLFFFFFSLLLFNFTSLFIFFYLVCDIFCCVFNYKFFFYKTSHFFQIEQIGAHRPLHLCARFFSRSSFCHLS